MVSDSAVQSSVNNTLAAGAGSGRASLMGMDRAGVSRGRGHQARAQMADAMASADASTAANKVQQDARNSNASAKLAYENMVRGENIQNAGLLDGLRHTQRMNQIARSNIAMDNLEAQQRGALGLASIQLDRTPLLQALMR